MSARFLIIDGYNLLHAAGMAQRNYSHGDLQRCRTRLIRFLLSKLSPAELERATLVFDARVPPPDRPNEFRITGMRVQFANPGGDADEMIEKLLAMHSSPTRVTLISSDRRLQTAARRRHARAVGSEAFFDQMSGRDRPARGEKSGKNPYDEIKQGPALSPGEIAAWQKVFGDIPGATWSSTKKQSTRDSSAAASPKPNPQSAGAPQTKAESAATVPSPPAVATPKVQSKRRSTRTRDQAIPDLTWDDLCRWLDDDRWLAEFGDAQDK